MIDSKEVLADFQFVANRISHFILETKDIETKGAKTQVSIEFDYDILKLEEQVEKHMGIVEFTVSIKARVKKSILLKLT